MKIVKALAASAALAMLAAQPVAAANPASKLSLSNVKSDVRASSKSGKSKALEGAALFGVIAGVVATVVIVAVVADGSDSN